MHGCAMQIRACMSKLRNTGEDFGRNGARLLLGGVIYCLKSRRWRRLTCVRLMKPRCGLVSFINSVLVCHHWDRTTKKTGVGFPPMVVRSVGHGPSVITYLKPWVVL